MYLYLREVAQPREHGLCPRARELTPTTSETMIWNPMAGTKQEYKNIETEQGKSVRKINNNIEKKRRDKPSSTAAIYPVIQGGP